MERGAAFYGGRGFLTETQTALIPLPVRVTVHYIHEKIKITANSEHISTRIFIYQRKENYINENQLHIDHSTKFPSFRLH